MKDAVITIWEWLAIKDSLRKSDIIFLFGGPLIEIPKKGFELLSQEYAPLIVATGNTGTFDDSGWDKPIADVFTKFLVDNKVDKNKIITQNKSMNTLEDVIFSIPLLENIPFKLSSAILVSRPLHQRRAAATFKKQLPKVTVMNMPCQEEHPSVLNNVKLKQVGIRCVQEYERIVKYSEKGDIENQMIPENIIKAINSLKQYLSEK